MKLAVGCPIFEREWSFDFWADSVDRQTWPDGTEVDVHFVYTPGGDRTLSAILRRFPDAKITEHLGSAFRNDERADTERYRLLATLRNMLLDSVRTTDADYFLSWDSDMIFDPVLHHLFERGPVSGALLEMLGSDWMLDDHREAAFPSWMLLKPGGYAERTEEWWPMDQPFRVGVVMGTVLMTREVVEQARYAYHPQGEDIGFALDLERLGFDRWLIPTARGVHLHVGPGDREAV